MKDLFEKIFKYGYHDTTLTTIKAERDCFVLFFEKGVYFLDDEKRETDLTGPVHFTIAINRFGQNIFSYTSILKLSFNNNKHYEIDPKSFLMRNSANTFEIENIFYSGFNNTLLLFAWKRNNRYLLIFENCSDFVSDEL